MKTVIVLSRKGGVGKTTTINALGVGLMRKKKKVLFIDMDGQSNLTLIMGAQESESSHDLLTSNTNPKSMIQHTENGDIISGDESLQAIDVELALNGTRALQKAPEVFKKKLKALENDYDYCLIDTPAALNVITQACLASADKVIIPLNPDILSLQGIPRAFETIDFVKENLNSKLIVDGFLLVKYSERNPINRAMFDSLKDYSDQYGVKVYKTKISESIAMRESQATLKSIFDYAPDSKTAIDYLEFTKEFLKGEKK